MKKEAGTMIKPNALRKGDKVAVIAPAGPPDRVLLNQGIAALEEMGLNVFIGRHVFDGEEAGAHLIQNRVDDVHAAFRDPSIRAVFCANGGYGSAKLAPMLDYQLMEHNPKIFWGYSDLTYLLEAIRKGSGLVTFHGPMVASDLNEAQRTSGTLTSFSPLFTGESVTFDSRNSQLFKLAPGTGTGRIVGGNLTLLTNGMGTPYQVETSGAILLIEEVAEPAFRIDLMLTHLKQAGVFDQVEGVILGNFQVEQEEEARVSQVLEDFFASSPFPVVGNFPFGHCSPNCGIPLGVNAILSTSPPQLVIESGVV